jgi:hypothetical protein
MNTVQCSPVGLITIKRIVRNKKRRKYMRQRDKEHVTTKE